MRRKPRRPSLAAACRYATVGRGERSDSTLLAWDAGGRGLSRRRQDQRCIRACTLLPTARGRSGAAPNRCEQPARLACRAQRSLCRGSRQCEDSRLCSFTAARGRDSGPASHVSPEDSRIHLNIQDLPQRLRRFAAKICGKDRKAKIAKVLPQKSKDCKAKIAKILPQR